MGESGALENRTAERVIMDTEIFTQRMSRPDVAARMINNSSKARATVESDAMFLSMKTFALKYSVASHRTGLFRTLFEPEVLEDA